MPVVVRCSTCDAKIADICPVCDAPPPPQQPASLLGSTFKEAMASLTAVYNATLADNARLRELLARAETALAAYDDDTDVYAEAGILDRAG